MRRQQKLKKSSPKIELRLSTEKKQNFPNHKVGSKLSLSQKELLKKEIEKLRNSLENTGPTAIQRLIKSKFNVDYSLEGTRRLLQKLGYSKENLIFNKGNKLSLSQQALLKEEIQRLYETSGGIRTSVAQQLIKAKFNVDYTLQGARELLKKLGYSTKDSQKVNSKLSFAQETLLKEEIQKRYDALESTGPDAIQKLVKEKFDIEYTVDGTRSLLKRLGYSKQNPNLASGHRKLSLTQEALLKDDLIILFNTLEGAKDVAVRRLIKTKFNVEYSRGGIFDLLKRLGFSQKNQNFFHAHNKLSLEQYNLLKEEIRKLYNSSGDTRAVVIQKLIKSKFDVEFTLNATGRLMRNLGYSKKNQTISYRPSKLSLRQEVSLQEEIERLYDSLGDASVSDIQKLIKSKFNIEYTLRGIYSLLKRLGCSKSNPKFFHASKSNKLSLVEQKFLREEIEERYNSLEDTGPAAIQKVIKSKFNVKYSHSGTSRLMKSLGYSTETPQISHGNSKLSLAQEVLLKEEIEKLYNSLEDINPAEIQGLIKTKFNVEYSLGGMSGLLQRLGYLTRTPGNGKLSLEQQGLLKEEIDKLFTSSEEVKASAIQTLIKEKFNIDYSMHGTRGLLKRLGYSKKNPSISYGHRNLSLSQRSLLKEEIQRLYDSLGETGPAAIQRFIKLNFNMELPLEGAEQLIKRLGCSTKANISQENNALSLEQEEFLTKEIEARVDPSIKNINPASIRKLIKTNFGLEYTLIRTQTLLKKLGYLKKNPNIAYGGNKLSLAQKELLKEEIERCYESLEDIKPVEIQALIHSKFNVKYSVSGTHYLLKRLGYWVPNSIASLRRSKLSLAQEALLKKEIEKRYYSLENVGAPAIQKLIKSKFDIEYSASSVHELLKRLGCPKNNPNSQHGCSKLSSAQLNILKEKIEAQSEPLTKDITPANIQKLIKKTFDVNYSIQGIRHLLERLGYRKGKTKISQAKASKVEPFAPSWF